jgi:hypothetical protein
MVHHNNKHYHLEHRHVILPTTARFGTLLPPPFHRSSAAVVVLRCRNTLDMTMSSGGGRELRYDRNTAKSSLRSIFWLRRKMIGGAGGSNASFASSAIRQPSVDLLTVMICYCC